MAIVTIVRIFGDCRRIFGAEDLVWANTYYVRTLARILGIFGSKRDLEIFGIVLDIEIFEIVLQYCGSCCDLWDLIQYGSFKYVIC